MFEVVDKRGEYSKTFDLGNKQFRTQIGGMTQHWKEDYKNKVELFKETDLRFEKNRIDKAPYILIVDKNQVYVKDRKTGAESVVEIDSIGDTNLSLSSFSAKSDGLYLPEVSKDVDFKLITSDNRVRFQRIIKSEAGLKEAAFKISGSIPVSYHAVDADGDSFNVETYLDKGRLIETFTPEKTISTLDKDSKWVQSVVPVKYPIKIDPTLTIQPTSRDCPIAQAAATTNYENTEGVGCRNTSGTSIRSLMYFSLADIPVGAVIDTATLSLYYYAYLAGTKKCTGSETITLTKVRRSDWVEAQATWNIYKTSNNWGTAGCLNATTDIDTSISASASMLSNHGWLSFNVKNIVEDADINSVDFNTITSINNDGVNKYPYFASKEYATNTALRPKLVIEYTGAGQFLVTM